MSIISEHVKVMRIEAEVMRETGRNAWARMVLSAADTIETLSAKVRANNLSGGWIPVSEMLPKYRKVVLISTDLGVRVAERDAVKEDGTDDFWYLFLDDAIKHPRYVYAWMPLPEPYGGEDHED